MTRHVETFRVTLPRPEGPLWPALAESLRVDGRLPVRWAVVGVVNGQLVVEGARLCTRS